MASLLPAVWPGTGGLGIPRAWRTPCRYEAYLPDPLVGRALWLAADVVADVSDAERAIEHLQAAVPTIASLEAVSRLLLRAEAVGSSKIEGLEVAARRLVQAEAEHALAGSFSDRTAYEVLGNIEAMRGAVALGNRPVLNLDGLLAIHRTLMLRSPQPELGGRLRTTQNWIGGSDFNPCAAAYVPPPPQHVPALMEDLVAFINQDNHSPLVQAAVVHAQFETIHPFSDGNGRTGRALIHVVLGRRGLAPRFVPPISLILATRSRDYVQGLTSYRHLGRPDSPEAQAGMGNWIATFAAATARAAANAEQFGATVDALVRIWRERAAPVRRNSGVDRLLRVLPGAPIITVATASELIGQSTVSTGAAMARLVAAGVLRPTRQIRRHRSFEADGLLDALTRFERALASPSGDTRHDPPVRAVPYRPERS